MDICDFRDFDLSRRSRCTMVAGHAGEHVPGTREAQCPFVFSFSDGERCGLVDGHEGGHSTIATIALPAPPPVVPAKPRVGDIVLYRGTDNVVVPAIVHTLCTPRADGRVALDLVVFAMNHCDEPDLFVMIDTVEGDGFHEWRERAWRP